ncbi:Spy/CpxP family protein refolding chaperone, partial [Rubrivirga sp.]|uniref:Spy/CpxP family protein refolding chaperone n=1 Tax=Rubrivirga sp. TaxID=1885344 RepID=UPI003C7904B8
ERRGQRQDRVQLTDDQRDALRDIRSESREQRRALEDDLRSGRLSDDAFVDRMETVRSASRSRIAQVVPSEAASRLSERQDRRALAKQSREAALGLTADQKARLQTLRLDRIRTRPDAPDMRPFLDADGQLDRQAFRQARRERRSDMRPERQAARDAMADVLTDEQRDVIAIHRALSGGRAHRGRRGR